MTSTNESNGKTGLSGASGSASFVTGEWLYGVLRPDSSYRMTADKPFWELEALRLRTALAALPHDSGDDSLYNVRRLRAEIRELKAALQAVRDWYDRDGSVGGCENLMEEHVEPLTASSSSNTRFGQTE